MSAGAPWSVKGIDPKAREIAKDLARRSGMTLGDWLNQMIMEDGQEAPPQPAPLQRRRFDSSGPAPQRAVERPVAPVQRLEAEPDEDDEIARVAQSLDRLSARIEAAEHRSTLAISGIDQSVVGVLARIETAERHQNQVAARFEDAVDEVRSEQQTIAERLRELESARHGARSAEALKSLEGALTRVASHLYQGEGRTRDALEDLKRDVDGLSDRVQRVDRSNDPAGSAALIDQVVDRIAERLEQAEARTAQALKGLEGSFAHLDRRLATAEQALSSEEPAERRFETLAADLTQRVEQVRGELADRMSAAADTRFDRVEGVLREMTGHVQAAEQRSAQAIERMGQEVVRMTDSLAQKVQAVDHRNTDAIEQVGGEMARIADAVEGRMKRADSAQAEALEKLGSEIARITERLAERIANAERRSAQSMDDVGEQVARVTERLQQRQERASSELIDRMRQSEERTAKILDEAREKIDQRLREAQKALPLEPAAAPVMPSYGDPFAAGASFTGQDFGAFGGQAFADQPFAGQPFTGQPFGGQSFPVQPQPESFSGEPEGAGADSRFDQPDPFDAPPPAAPDFAPADIEAAEAFVAPADPVDSPVEDSAFDQDGFEAATNRDADAPEDPAATRSASTRELIAQARAAARAASAPPEGKAARGKGSGKGGAPSVVAAPLFSGFGVGRKKAKAESSALKTALLMSSAAAFLGIGTAGFVLQNGGAIAGWSNSGAAAERPAGLEVVADAQGLEAGAAPDAAPLDPRLALAISPAAATAPVAPPPEAQALYSAAVAQIEGGDFSGLEPLRKAANLGYAPAQYFLAKLYDGGKAGLKKDVPEARRWTERAAANGEPRAMHNLATYYYYGEGGPQNPAAAVEWFKKAAHLGWVDSQYNLAVMNEKGLGVRQNPAEAYKWYIIAARNGDEPSRGKSAELKKSLSASEVAATERAAASFRPEAPNPSARAALAPASPTSSASVIAAQRALARLGYYQGPADGAASPALRLAISAYQRDQGLTASGALTPDLAQRFAAAR